MTKLLAFLLLAFYTNFASGQIKTEKIKVILLGTFHYGETSDRNKTDFSDLLSEKRQKELDTISTALNNFQVSKFFLETPVNRQKQQDDLYELYKQNLLKTPQELSDERVQIAFRTALKNNIPLVAADFKMELPYGEMYKYDKKHKNDSNNPYPFFDIPYPFKIKLKPLKDCSLSEYYIQLNNEYSRQVNLYDYLHYALSSGEGDEYVGEKFTSAWYDRNLKIFTNILRQIDIKKDKTIVILFGAGHTAVLRQFFENHPLFEIIELDKILK